MEQYHAEVISVQMVAETFAISERSARRILQQLEKEGLAISYAEEQPRGRGRPRKLYKILL